MEKKIMLIVDPQNDFISGSLSVDTATFKMLKLAEHLKEHAADYKRVFVTADYHPAYHCSFSINGGQWPVHCRQRYKGAKIYPELFKVLCSKELRDKYAIAYKGLNPDVEEYSVFALDDETNITNSGGFHLYNEIYNLLENNEIDQIEVCGIAGDFCVYNTIKDLMKLVPKDKIRVLEKFCASIDGGEKLSDLCYYHNLKHTVN